MDLILWRHADAQPGSPDLARELTPKGLKQAQDVARWLRTRLKAPPRILVSPAQRTLQTARALSEDYEIVAELAPGGSAAGVLAAAGWPQGQQAVLVVGHQPTLGEVASLLIAGVSMPWSIRKAAVWWISQRNRDEHQAMLRAVVGPEFT